MKRRLKWKMNELTFCIPVRIDSEYRKKNLSAILEFYSAHVDARYFIIEADTEQHIKELPTIDGLHYEYIKDENPFFHRTYYINRMLAKVATKVAAIWDVDAIVPVSQLWESYNCILKLDEIMVYPYNGAFWAVNKFFSSVFYENYEIELFTNFPMPKTLLGGYHSVGGGFLVDVKKYKICGWENEYFIGWGPEDLERFHRMQILGNPPVRVKGELYHLYHTRGVNSGSFDAKLAYSTKKEFCNVCKMLPSELRAYIDTWQWIKNDSR